MSAGFYFLMNFWHESPVDRNKIPRLNYKIQFLFEMVNPANQIFYHFNLFIIFWKHTWARPTQTFWVSIVMLGQNNILAKCSISLFIVLFTLRMLCAYMFRMY